MNIKWFTYLSFIAVLSSCSNIYIRYSYLHHLPNTVSLKILKNNECNIIIKSNSDHRVTKMSCEYVDCTEDNVAFQKDSCLVFLDKGKIIYFSKSFWVKKGSPDSLRLKYTNTDLSF